MKLLLSLFFSLILILQINAQLCGNAVNAPATINGVNVTGSGTGSVDVFPSAFSSCSPAITTPSNSLWLGSTGSFSYTYNFSAPVNNLIFIITATGTGSDENFIITTNVGVPTINSPQNCFTTINGNEILSGFNGGAFGGGGIFEVASGAPYTSITISGSGGEAGSLFALCETSVVPDVCANPSADLVLDLNVNNAAPSLGCEVIYTITLTNNGPCTANLTTVQNALPAGLTLVSSNPSVGTITGNTWNVGDLTNGSTATLELVATVNSIASLVTTATASTTSLDPNVVNNFESLSISPFNGVPNAGQDASIDLCQSATNTYSIPTMLSVDAEMNGLWSETSVNPSGQFNNVSGNFNLANLNPGEYTFQYSVNNGCLDDIAEMTVNVIGQPDITDLADQNVCVSYTLPAISGANLSGNQAYFTGPNGTGIQYNAGSIISDPMDLYIYDVNPIANQCADETIFSIDILTEIQPEFVADVLEGCSPLSVNFSNLTLNAQQCLWNFGDGSISNDCGIVNHVYEDPGLYDVTLNVTIANGCTGTLNIPQYIQVNQSPTAQFTYSPIDLSLLNTEVEFINQSVGADSYEWEFGDGQSSSVISPIHEFPETVNESYTVLLIAGNQGICFDTAMISINIEDILLFYVPNTFTPDGDEHNQVFKPILTSGFDASNYLLQIFNRWGELLYESKNAEIGWDGTYNGKLVQDGTYSWKISVGASNNDNKYIRKGSVLKMQ